MAEAEQREVVNVVCCLWGDWPDNPTTIAVDKGGSGDGAQYVQALYNAVERNCTVPYRFICFADDVSRVPEGIEARPLNPPNELRWKGCLPKLYVYSPEAGLDGPTMLFDLDNVITGSIDDMLCYRGKYCVRAKLPPLSSGKYLPDGDMIFFQPEAARHLWRCANYDMPRVVRHSGGRERYFIRQNMQDADVWQRTLPGHVVSYKHHCRRNGLPEDARVVTFHGRPRPHECLDIDWVAEHWR